MLDDLFENEEDCDLHNLPVTVLYKQANPVRRPDIVAGMLRVLAQYTDGFCATRSSDDKDIVTSGMVFHFTTEAKRISFKARIRYYLESNVYVRLTIS